MREGQAWEGCFFFLGLSYFCCNSYVNRSIELFMYVDSTKFNLTKLFIHQSKLND